MQHATDRSAMLGTMKMGALVPRVSIPIMVSMLVQALYNVVDSIFVSRFDPNGLTAVSLAYPFQMLMIALSVGMGTGINSLLSRHLGAKRPEEARKASWNGLLIEGAGALLFILMGLFLAKPLMETVVSDSLMNAEKILQMGISYLSIVTTFSLGLFLSVYSERMLQATGNTTLSMLTQLSGAVTNIVLDPIMIFGLLGFPRMGVAGAAVATVIGQHVSALTGLALNQFRNPELKLDIRDFGITKHALTGILAVGLPSSVMQALGSVMNLGMNGILTGFAQSNAALNVLSIYFKLQSFIFMPVFGLSNGIIAILAYNFGARRKERVYQCLKVALIWAITIMLIGMLIFMAFPQQLMAIFESDAEAELTAQMTSIGVTAMRIISIGFVMAAVGIVVSTLFQALGQGTYSLITSLCRQLVVLLPVAWLIARITQDVYAVWWCFPIAECVSLCISLLFYRKCNREILSGL
ncbi:MAG: MATE family efflux transporter [Clostridia bacterium]|nr:MATE family efflux transporter [Clostridia bacterium]